MTETQEELNNELDSLFKTLNNQNIFKLEGNKIVIEHSEYEKIMITVGKIRAMKFIIKSQEDVT